MPKVRNALRHCLALVSARAEPPVGIERLVVREHGFVVVQEDGARADGGVGGYRPLAELQGVIRMHARQAVEDAVAETEAFFDDGGQVGELLERLKAWWVVGVGYGGLELGQEAREDRGVGENVVGGCCEHVRRGQGSGAHERGCLCREAGQGLLAGRQAWVVTQGVENGEVGSSVSGSAGEDALH